DGIDGENRDSRGWRLTPANNFRSGEQNLNAGVQRGIQVLRLDGKRRAVFTFIRAAEILGDSFPVVRIFDGSEDRVVAVIKQRTVKIEGTAGLVFEHDFPRKGRASHMGFPADEIGA